MDADTRYKRISKLMQALEDEGVRSLWSFDVRQMFPGVPNDVLDRVSSMAIQYVSGDCGVYNGDVGFEFRYYIEEKLERMGWIKVKGETVEGTWKLVEREVTPNEL